MLVFMVARIEETDTDLDQDEVPLVLKIMLKVFESTTLAMMLELTNAVLDAVVRAIDNELLLWP